MECVACSGTRHDGSAFVVLAAEDRRYCTLSCAMPGAKS
jgi:hypothetical protein